MMARGDLIRLLIASLLAASVASGASAQVGESDYAQTGFYLGAAGGIGIENAHDSPVDDSWAINGWLGYRALPLVAIEAQVEHTTADNLKGDSGGLESITWTANGRLYLGTGRFQPFALAGIGMSFAREDEDTKVGNNADLAIRAGGGLETHITAGLSIVLSGTYVASIRANRHLDYTSATVGVQYQF